MKDVYINIYLLTTLECVHVQGVYMYTVYCTLFTVTTILGMCPVVRGSETVSLRLSDIT